MADNATLTPPEASKQALPSVDDLASQFNAPSYQGGDAGDNQSLSSQLSDVRNKARMQTIRNDANNDPLNRMPRDNSGANNRRSGPASSYTKGGQSDLNTKNDQAGKEKQKNRKASTGQGGGGITKGGDDDGDDGDDKGGFRSNLSALNKLRQNRKNQGQDPDYPYPISNVRYFVWTMIAVNQDLAPLLFDFIGIGWVIGYAILPVTWFMYFYLIIRFVPKPLFWKFVFRSALVSAVGIIPGLGEILPEWTSVAVGGYIMIKRYEAGLESLDSKVSGGKTSAVGGKNQKGGGASTKQGGGGGKNASTKK